MSYGTEHYYLIYDDMTSKETANEDGTTSKIADYVLSFCSNNDPLHVFFDNEVKPIVTTKDELIYNGMAMGIMRDNSCFETL